jgi:hypothetical protein
LRAQLLQMLYSIRSEQLLMEEIDYSVLFRWFVGLNLDEEVWDATTFTKNRDRLLEAEVAEEFLARVVERARSQGLTSDEHFTVDGTLLEAWAGAKSFQRKNRKTPPPDDPGNPTVNFTGRIGAMRRMHRRPIGSQRHFERSDSINNVGSQARVDFGGANQPKGSEERSRTCSL